MFWLKQNSIYLTEWCISGKNNIADQLSCQDQVPLTEWSLHLQGMWASHYSFCHKSKYKTALVHALFQIPRLGRKMLSSTVGTISVFMTSLHWLF